MQEDTTNQNKLQVVATSTSSSTDLDKEFAPFSPVFAANPHPFYARARLQEPVFFSQSLKRLEIGVALEQLGKRLPSLRLVLGQQFSYTPGLAFHGLEQLFVEWDSSAI